MAPLIVFTCGSSHVYCFLKTQPNWQIHCFKAATKTDIEKLWLSVESVDASVTPEEKRVKALLPQHPKIKNFIKHCCWLRHYSFCIKKCGKVDCVICKLHQLPSDVFQEVNFLPNPIPNSDGHYKPFETVSRTMTIANEEHCHHFRNLLLGPKHWCLFASVQHAKKHQHMMIQYEEFELWRLV
jgi:hypothetical protein